MSRSLRIIAMSIALSCYCADLREVQAQSLSIVTIGAFANSYPIYYQGA